MSITVKMPIAEYERLKNLEKKYNDIEVCLNLYERRYIEVERSRNSIQDASINLVRELIDKHGYTQKQCEEIAWRKIENE